MTESNKSQVPLNKASTLPAKGDRAPAPDFTLEKESVPPVNRDVPYVSQETRLLNCTMGNWDGEPTAYSYRWTVGGEVYLPSDTSTYFIVAEDTGMTASCVVTATNAAGSTEAPPSNEVVIAPYVDNTLPPTPRETLQSVEMKYWINKRGHSYAALTPNQPQDQRILFPSEDAIRHVSQDSAGNPIDPLFEPAVSMDTITSSTGVQNTTTVASSGNVRVSGGGKK